MKQLSTNELREAYLSFFEARGHVRIPSAPLVPHNDPSVLFTTAGMHPLVPYLNGQPHPAGQRLVSVQKCLRTRDIDDVGDATHATVFEMLGNWSLGDYFKTEAINLSWEFLTSARWLGIDPQYLAVSVFKGDATTPRDEESAGLWRQVGVPPSRIAYLGKEENWWPAGGGAAGPQGPDTEIFYWTGGGPAPATFDPSDIRWVEIWNDVFMEYTVTATGRLEALPQRNVDTGMGLERVVMALGGHESIYDIDSFGPLTALIKAKAQTFNLRHARIVADHIKAATFVLADEEPIVPGRSGQGYVVRRLIRRAYRSARALNLSDPAGVMQQGVALVVAAFGAYYPSLPKYERRAQDALAGEINKFSRGLDKGLRQFESIVAEARPGDIITGGDAFRLHETFGFPVELTAELARERKLEVDMEGFLAAQNAHQEKSRTAASGHFKGGLTDTSAMSVKYHTATHLLHQALRDVLGKQALQRGSNISAERLRFDFAHAAKLTAEELQAVSDIVNKKIRANLSVQREEMSVDEARQRGALGLFTDKYRKAVTVYSIGDYSREICGGPHAKRTGVLGSFVITKEESAGAGVRRIRAVLQ